MISRYSAPLALALISFTMSATGLAQLISFSASADPNASPDANGDTVNVWSVSTTSPGDPNVNGSFLGDSAGNGFGGSLPGAGAPAWALYANNANEAAATASISGLVGRPLTQAGEFVALDFDNGEVDSGGEVGIQFLDAFDNEQLSFSFMGGLSTYEILDDTGFSDTFIPFTAHGFRLTLTLESGLGSYNLDVGGTPFAGLTGQQGTTSIASVRVFNNSAGPDAPRNVYFNNLQVSTVPEPSAALLLGFVASILVGRGCVKRFKSAA